jgi:transcriptional regulator with GAF, ATPase, and Fis domain
MLNGETGTGKSVLAARIHELSARSPRPMVHVNCTRLIDGRLANDLFGSDDRRDRQAESESIGLLRLAESSTLFLDEIADLTLETQARLARMLQHKHGQPQGTDTSLKMDVRIIAATRRDLTRCVEEGTFRQDLYSRLNALPIHVPPLRERPDDIAPLVWQFIDEFAEAYARPIETIDKTSMAALQQYGWPGNVRELRNIVERAMMIGGGRHLDILLPGMTAGAVSRRTLADVERAHILATMAACGWQIGGANGAAARLGVKPRVLETRMSELGIRRPRL